MPFDIFPTASSGGSTIVKRQVITATGTFNKPAGMLGSLLWVTAIGGGGSGNVSATTTSLMGGDGGQYIVREPVDIGSDTSVSVTVGAGGSAIVSPGVETLGNSGGTTSFGAYLSVSGGRGGMSTSTYTGGAQGRRNLSGSSSFAQSTSGPFGCSGGGNDGNALGGHGGAGLVVDVSGTAGDRGENGNNEGMGGWGYGAGGGSSTNSTSGTGGAGAPGVVMVEWLEAL